MSWVGWGRKSTTTYREHKLFFVYSAFWEERLFLKIDFSSIWHRVCISNKPACVQIQNIEENYMMTEPNRYVNCMIVHNQKLLKQSSSSSSWTGRYIESVNSIRRTFGELSILGRKIVKFQLVIKSIQIASIVCILHMPTDCIVLAVYRVYLSSSDDSSKMATYTTHIVSMGLHARV